MHADTQEHVVNRCEAESKNTMVYVARLAVCEERWHLRHSMDELLMISDSV